MSYPLPSFKKNDEGVYLWTTPLKADTAKIPLFDPASDTGLFVAAQLLQGKASLGKRILGSSGYVTPNEAAAIYSKITRNKAAINTIPLEVFKGFLPPAAAEDLAGNMQLVNEPGYYVGEPAGALEDSIKQVEEAGLPGLMTWEKYVVKHAEKSA